MALANVRLIVRGSTDDVTRFLDLLRAEKGLAALVIGTEGSDGEGPIIEGPYMRLQVGFVSDSPRVVAYEISAVLQAAAVKVADSIEAVESPPGAESV